MNRLTIKCPKCGSNIDANYDNDIFFCGSCGSGYKILREGQSNGSRPPKIRVAVLDSEDKAAFPPHEESRRLDPKDPSNTPKSKGGKSFLPIFLIVSLGIIVVLGILFINLAIIST